MEIPNKKKKLPQEEIPQPVSHTDEILGHILQNQHQHATEHKAINENHLMATAHGNKLLENNIEAHGRVIDEHKKTNEILSGLAPDIKDQANTTAKMAKFLEEMKGEDGHTPTDEELLAIIKPLIPEPIPGHTPTDEELLSLIRPLIPIVKDGETPSDERLLSLISPLVDNKRLLGLLQPLIDDIKIPQPLTETDIRDIVKPLLRDIPKPEKFVYPTSDEIVSMIKGKLSYSDIANIPNLELYRRQSSKTVSLSELDDVDLTALTKNSKGKYILGGGTGSSILLKTNGTNNGSQSILNLIQGSNVTITDDGLGGITIASTGGGTPTLGKAFVGFGDASNQLTGNSDLTWSTGGKMLTALGNILSQWGTAAENVMLGTVSSGAGYPGIWFGANATAPDFTNYSFLYDSTRGPVFNSGVSSIDFRIGNVTNMVYNAYGLAINNSTTGTTSGTALLIGTGGVKVDTTTFNIDATNHRVGIGTATPSQKLDVIGNASITGALIQTGGSVTFDVGTSGTFLGSSANYPDGLLAYYDIGDFFIGDGNFDLNNTSILGSDSTKKLTYIADTHIFNNNVASNTVVGIGTATPGTSTSLGGGIALDLNGNFRTNGYLDIDFPLASGGGLIGTSGTTLLFQMGFNAQAQYGGTLGTTSGNQFFVYNFQDALGGVNNYYWGFNNSGDNFWGSSNTLYSVRVQQPRTGNVPLSILGVSGQTANLFQITKNGGSTGGVMTVLAGGNIGVGGVTSPTAKLHLAAGTSTAGTAPLKLTTGTALGTPEDGALEYHTSHLYFTIGSTRYQLDQQGGGGSGDMILASAQTNSGVKTFLDGTMGLRNVANTFTSFFTNTNTASRTYTLKDATGTLAFTSDIGSWGALNYPTWVSGTPFVKMTAAGTFALDTNTYLTGNQSITLGGFLSGSGTTSITAQSASKFILQGTTDANLTGAQFLGALSTGLVKNTTTTGVLSIATDGTDYLSPTTGITVSQTSGQTLGTTTNRLTKLWATDITVTNAIAGSVTGNAGTVTNATLTTALTNNGGAGTLTWPAAGATLTIPTGGGTLGTAAFTASSAYEVPLTFSTGLTRTTNTITVNTSQNISTLSNLTSNGLIKTSGGTGALSIATAATDYVAPSAYASANGLTMSTARLLGRTTASSGAAEEITVGSGLTLSAGTLSAAGGSATATTQSVTQTAHGFAVNDVIKFSGTTYQKAKADTAANAEVVGIVTAVADANNFTFAMEGYVTGLSALTSDTVYFLSDATAGLLTATEPTTVGSISKPILKTTSTTTGVISNMRGIVVSSPGASKNWISISSCALPANSTVYFGFLGTAVGTNGTANGVEWVAPMAGTIKNFYMFMYETLNGTAANTAIWTLMKNNVAQTVTFTQTVGDTTQTYSDTTHSFTVAAGDKICIRTVTTAITANTGRMSGGGFEFDPS